MRLIGVTGRARSGKDLTAKLIAELQPGVVRIALADPIKRICAELFDFSEDQADGKLKEIPDPRFELPDGSGFLSPRRAYQILGTEVARSIYKDVWIDYALKRSHDVLNGAKQRVGRDVYVAGGEPANLVVWTDVRFINEAQKIKAAGGTVWRVTRQGVESRLAAAAQVHPSEMEQQSQEFSALVDETLANDGTVEDLRIKVAEALGKVLQ